MPAKRKKRDDGRFSTSIHVIDPLTGKTVRKYIYGKTQKELLQNVEKTRKQIYSADTTFKVFSDNWYQRNKSSVSQNTHRMYDTAFNHLTPLFPRSLKSITPSDIQDLISDISDTPNQANKVLSTLDQIFSDAVKLGILLMNPCDHVAKLKYRKEETRVVTNNELEVIEKTVFTLREQLFLALIRNYGLRKEEALALEKKHFDFDQKKLIIEQAFTYRHNQPELSSTKSVSGERILPLAEEDISFFQNAFKEIKTDFLFTNGTSDTPISATSYKRMWASIQKKMDQTARRYHIDIPGDITSKMFRHTFCTDLALAGVPVKVAQYLMGHKTAAVTLNIYSHVSYSNIDPNILTDFRKKMKSQR